MTKALTCGSGNIRCVRKVWAAIEIPLITKSSKSMRAEVVLFLPHTPRTVQPVPLAVS